MQAKLQNTDFLLRIITFLCLPLAAIAVWFVGPYLSIGEGYPLAKAEKRLYVILFLCLLWVLKFLLLDLDHLNPFTFKDPRLQRKLKELKSRFQGAMRFLKKTPINKHYPNAKLEQLPWYLLIGPTHGGKTALLANAKVHYILHRPLTDKNALHFNPSLHYDWWVTKDVTLVDVPGQYLSLYNPNEASGKETLQPIFWRFFLRLVKKQRGKKGINGLVIALPLPEIIQNSDPKKYQSMLKQLFQRLFELKKMFPQDIPCYFVITKCDLLPGFETFFNELSDEEAAHAWGVPIELKPHQTLLEAFNIKFNSLIKKINQQLISRLHQERNPLARPFVKDFPLQVERLKDVLQDFLKKFAETNFALSVKGVYLSSALQIAPEENTTILANHAGTNQKGLQVLTAPAIKTRPYFIKQFLAQGLSHTRIDKRPMPIARWKRYAAFTASLTIIVATSLLLGRDFHSGLDQTQEIQQYLSHYQSTIQTNGPSDRLPQTLALLDALDKAAQDANNKFSMRNLISFYTRKSQQTAGLVYYQSLRNILLPEIRLYLEDYLKYPLTKNLDQLYHVLKAYIMLGNEKHFEADYVLSTLNEIMPETTLSSSFKHHTFLALNTAWVAQALNVDIVQQTRKFLIAMPSVQLSYLILKNMENNNSLQPVNLGIRPDSNGPFMSNAVNNQIPLMYTANSFPTILSQEANLAGQEAIFGNWILGNNPSLTKNPELASALVDQLRLSYVNHYIDKWENIINSIQLTHAKNLAETDDIITKLIREDSPLLQLLQTLHDNTYFEPILSSSFKLQNLGVLVDKIQQPDNLLIQILDTLRELHLNLQTVLAAPNIKKASFAIVSKRMANHEEDILTKIRALAEKSPTPIKIWLNSIANNTWHQLMKEAAGYIDTSWQNQVSKIYQTEIAERYPFFAKSDEEVEWQKFTLFFGNPGIFMNFYHHYLEAFVDKSQGEWKWKIVENLSLPFSKDALRQIQQASLIHDQFFPEGNDKPAIQFSLRRYRFDKQINSVKLNINDHHINDTRKGKVDDHTLIWPNLSKPRVTSIQLVMANKKIINRNYPGDWGWYRLVNQAYETSLPNNEIVVNFSLNKQSAKYVLKTSQQHNPFITNYLKHFTLPLKLETKVGV